MIWIIVLLLSVALFIVELAAVAETPAVAAIHAGIYLIMMLFSYFLSKILFRIVLAGNTCRKLPDTLGSCTIFFAAGFMIIFLAEIMLKGNSMPYAAISALRAAGLALVVYKGIVCQRT